VYDGRQHRKLGMLDRLCYVADHGDKDTAGAAGRIGSPRMTGEVGMTVEELKARSTELLEMLGDSIADAVHDFSQRGVSATWFVAAFDGSDERGMRVYRKLEPTGEDVPRNGAIAVPCHIIRLESAAFKLGYKRSPGQWGTHVPGSVRVATFTSGIIVVREVRTIDMGEPGSA
jgi:hypothetical protein